MPGDWCKCAKTNKTIQTPAYTRIILYIWIYVLPSALCPSSWYSFFPISVVAMAIIRLVLVVYATTNSLLVLAIYVSYINTHILYYILYVLYIGKFPVSHSAGPFRLLPNQRTARHTHTHMRNRHRFLHSSHHHQAPPSLASLASLHNHRHRH